MLCWGGASGRAIPIGVGATCIGGPVCAAVQLANLSPGPGYAAALAALTDAPLSLTERPGLLAQAG